MVVNRRYDIDWIRVIAIGLLIIYHTAIGFQPWGMMIGFITTKESWESLWIPMTLLNIWRIPLLFFVSGMGVHFAIQNRNWKQLVGERSQRILIPFIFGIFCINPIHSFILMNHYNMPFSYRPDTGHLWFLGNIFVYVLIFAPLFFILKKNESKKPVLFLKKLLSTPAGLILPAAALAVEAIVINPQPYELYVMTKHGFFLGLIAFFSGFCFMLSGERFMTMIVRWRWLFFLSGLTLYTTRMIKLQNMLATEPYLLSIESFCWILSILAFGYKYLNKPGHTLTYLSEAAYPVYILHMIFLFLGSSIIFDLNIAVQLKYVLTVIFTLAGSIGTFEIIRRVKLLRPLFGLKWKKRVDAELT